MEFIVIVLGYIIIRALCLSPAKTQYKSDHAFTPERLAEMRANPRKRTKLL